MSQDKLVLIRQALAAAESSVKTAKQLLSEIESGGLHVSAKDLPGETGVFDGNNMITENGEKIEVPANYASKSMLVVGDTLKQIDENGTKRFKQVEHVKRHKTTGILHKKDGKFKVITPEGSYNVLEAAVEHFSGSIGDEVVLHLPAGNLTSAYGAIERVVKANENVETSISQPQLSGEVNLQQPVTVDVSEPRTEERQVGPQRVINDSSMGGLAKSSPKKKRRKKTPEAIISSNKVEAVAPVPTPAPARPSIPSVSARAVVPMPAPGEDDELR
jgi:hypothetical protein